jgi:hypothetical protein
VARRYNEFDALRHFFMVQDPHNSDFQQSCQRFPGKVLLFRKSVLDARLRGLEEFINFFCENSRYCRQNGLDALCSFLQIPENYFLAGKLGNSSLKSVPLNTLLPSHSSNLVSPPSTPNNQQLVSVEKTTISNSTNVRADSSPNKQLQSTTIQAVDNKLATIISKDTSLGQQVNHTSTVLPPQQVIMPAPLPPTSSSSILNPPSTSTSLVSSPPIPNSLLSPSPIIRQPSPPITVLQQITQDSNDELRHLTPAQARLVEVLGDGMTIIKHGRQGAPKVRKLRCNRQATELFIQADDHRKTVKLSEVESIRLGTEVDIEKSSNKPVRDDASDSGVVKKPSMLKRASMSFRMQESGILYGTATLRRTCKTEDMKLCISLIMPDRTFDIQCKSEEDLNLLYTTLSQVCSV